MSDLTKVVPPFHKVVALLFLIGNTDALYHAKNPFEDWLDELENELSTG
jgi:hypothetical protein